MHEEYVAVGANTPSADIYARTPDNNWNELKERQEWVYINSASNI